MNVAFELPWRVFLSGTVIAGGSTLFVHGAQTLVRALHISIWNLDRPIVWIGGFRAAIIGLAVVGLGAAWLSEQLWVLLLALAIGGEELLETSVILFALRCGRRSERTLAPAK